MPLVECLACSADAVVLRVDLLCRGCLAEVPRLVDVDRPVGRASAPACFRRQRLWQRLAFNCPVCGYGAADFRRVIDARPEDFDHVRAIRRQWPETRPDPYPALPRVTALSRRFGMEASDLAA